MSLHKILQNQDLTASEYNQILSSFYQHGIDHYEKALLKSWSHPTHLTDTEQCAHYLKFIESLPSSDTDNALTIVQCDQLCVLRNVLVRYGIQLPLSFHQELYEYFIVDDTSLLSDQVKSFFNVMLSSLTLSSDEPSHEDNLIFIHNVLKNDWIIQDMGETPYLYEQFYAYWASLAAKFIPYVHKKMPTYFKNNDILLFTQIIKKTEKFMYENTLLVQWDLELMHHLHYRNNIFALRQIYQQAPDQQEMFDRDLSFMGISIKVLPRLDF